MLALKGMAQASVHVPILLDPIVTALTEGCREWPAGSWIVDCTLGGGGHTRGLLQRLREQGCLGSAKVRVLAVDQDQAAIERARETFATELAGGELELLHSSFGAIGDWVRTHLVHGLMADLGFSSDQIEDAERGLSFLREGPLDMRLDPSSGRSCREFLQGILEKDLEKLIGELGEERFAGRIARAIVQRRRETGVPTTTRELAEVIFRAVPPNARHGRIHPATRTFQALRIAVNDELGQLDSLLDHVLPSIQQGGRVAILSFHSLEDRRVKRVFKSRDSGFRQLTKKPIEADESEVERNPRSRSAKLRVAVREPSTSDQERSSDFKGNPGWIDRQ
jgi:16S rRNA (cytosine1402-N4)-methyltransferase